MTSFSSLRIGIREKIQQQLVSPLAPSYRASNIEVGTELIRIADDQGYSDRVAGGIQGRQSRVDWGLGRRVASTSKPLQLLFQVGALDELHGDELESFRFARGQDPDDVRVLEPPGRDRLELIGTRRELVLVGVVVVVLLLLLHAPGAHSAIGRAGEEGARRRCLLLP